MGYATLSPEPSNYPAAMAAVLDFLPHICSFWKDFIIWQIRKHNWLNSYVEFPNDTNIMWRVIQVIGLPSLVTFARVISETIIGMWKSNLRKLRQQTQIDDNFFTWTISIQLCELKKIQSNLLQRAPLYNKSLFIKDRLIFPITE